MGVVYPDSEKTRGTEVLRTLSRPLQKLTQIGIADGDAADFALDAGEGVVDTFGLAAQLGGDLAVGLAELVAGQDVPLEVGEHLLQGLVEDLGVLVPEHHVFRVGAVEVWEDVGEVPVGGRVFGGA